MRFKAALVLVLAIATTLAAQVPLTQFYLRFIYDDGTAVSGGLQIFQGVPPNGVNVLGMTLDVNGRINGMIPLDPTQLYYGALNFTDPTGKAVTLGYDELPICGSTCSQPAIALLPTGEVVITIAKATDALCTIAPCTGITFGPIPPIVAGMTLTPPSATLTTGATISFTANVTCGIIGCSPAVTWSSNGGTLTPGLVNTAQLTAPAAAGTITVTATSVADPTKTQTATVTVTSVPVTFTQTKFAGCVSTPPFAAAPNPSTFTTTDTGGGLAAGYILPAETYDCPVTIPTAGSYLLNIRAESPNNGIGLHFEYPAGTMIGSEVTVNKTIANWGANENWTTFSGGTATLPAGQITIRVKVDTTTKWALNLNWFN